MLILKNWILIALCWWFRNPAITTWDMYIYIYINSPVNHGRFQPPTSTGDVIARFRMNHQTVSLVQNFDCIVGLHWKDIFWSEGVTRTMVTNQWSLTAGSLTLFACFLLLFEIRLLEHLDVFPPCFIQFSYLLSWSEPPQKTPKFSGSKIQQYNRLYIFWTSSIFFTKTWAERFFWSHPGRSMPRRGRSSMLQLKNFFKSPSSGGVSVLSFASWRVDKTKRLRFQQSPWQNGRECLENHENHVSIGYKPVANLLTNLLGHLSVEKHSMSKRSWKLPLWPKPMTDDGVVLLPRQVPPLALPGNNKKSPSFLWPTKKWTKTPWSLVIFVLSF